MIGRRAVLAAGASLAAGVVTGCGYGSKAAERHRAGPEPAAGAAKLSAGEVRIGHLANLTHATPLIGLRNGSFAAALGGTRIRTQVFNAGTAEVEALNSGAVDIGWIGPTPTVNAWAKSGGAALRIVSGATSGGARLVVAPSVGSVADLRGRQIATPQAGNTQDVALLDFLRGQGFRVDPKSGRGDVSVLRVDNKLVPSAYAQGQIDGAWVPEPTASVLLAEGAKVLVDERSQWPDGRFVTTHVVVAAPFLAAHPDVVSAVLGASVDTNAWIDANPVQAGQQAGAALAELTGKALEPAVLARAWPELTITDDPLAESLKTQAGHAAAVGLVGAADLAGIYDLTLLNRLLAARGRPAVSAAGLGRQ